MTGSFPIEEILWKAGPLLNLLLLWRLTSLRLYGRYRALTAYVAFSALRSLVLMAVSLRNPNYGIIYAVTTPLLWILSALVALEIYSMVLGGYRGLSIFTRKTLLIALSVSALGSVAFVAAGLDFTGEPFPVLRMVFMFEQAVALTLFFFLLILALFLLWYPIPLPKNLILYSFGFSLILFTVASSIGIRNLAGHEWTRAVSTVILGIYTACLLGWLVFVTAAGEIEIRSASIPRGELEERRLLEQLNALNALLETGRKS